MYKFRLYLMERLLKKGIAVYVLAPRDSYSERFEHLPGLTFIELRHLKAKSISPLQDLLLVRELTERYREIRPSLVFHYTIKANIFGSMAAHRAGVRSVSVVTGLGYTFTGNGWLRQIASGLYRRAWRYDTDIWVLNEDDRKELHAKRLADPEQIMLLPGEGVDTEHFYPAPYNQQASEPVTFLFIGRIMRSKGVTEFVQAAGQLKERGLPVRCNLLGFIDDNPAAIPRRQVEDWHRQGAVTWLGQADDVRPYIEKADCIVLPSYREGMPFSLLEGSSMCKTLIAANSPGCRSLVDDGVNGYLCRIRDSNDLAKKMETYFHLSPAAKRQMGMAAREKLLPAYTRDHIFEVYMKKISSLTTAD
jgi:hypothetical protein